MISGELEICKIFIYLRLFRCGPVDYIVLDARARVCVCVIN